MKRGFTAIHESERNIRKNGLKPMEVYKEGKDYSISPEGYGNKCWGNTKVFR